MTVYKINWHAFVTDQSLDDINSAAGTSVSRDQLKPYIASICRSSGGLPVTENKFTTAQRTKIVLRLVTEALAKLIRSQSHKTSQGYVREPLSGQPLQHRLIKLEHVDINNATKEQLEALPEIGPGLAQRIIEERLENGAFLSFEGLANRVNGIGDAVVSAIRYRVHFGEIAQFFKRQPIEQSLDTQLLWLMNRSHSDSMAQRLIDSLNQLAIYCAGDEHPFTKQYLPRDFEQTPLAGFNDAEWVGLLSNSNYYFKLKALLASASTSIDICMFHIALPTTPHPTLELLDTLIQAKNNGVTVRVLLDADRVSDPYLSTVINTAAKEYLQAAGVSVKFDKPETLLHSKFVHIDQSVIVLGSHNWSAGSYFQFDDLSLAVKSAALSTQLTSRFDSLWTNAL